LTSRASQPVRNGVGRRTFEKTRARGPIVVAQIGSNGRRACRNKGSGWTGGARGRGTCVPRKVRIRESCAGVEMVSDVEEGPWDGNEL